MRVNRSDLQRTCVQLAQSQGILDINGVIDPNLGVLVSQKHFFPVTNDAMKAYILKSADEGVNNTAREALPAMARLLVTIEAYCGNNGTRLSTVQRDKDPSSPNYDKNGVVVNHNHVVLPQLAGPGVPGFQELHEAFDFDALHAACYTQGQAPARRRRAPVAATPQASARPVKHEVEPGEVTDLVGEVKDSLQLVWNACDVLNERWLEREQEIALLLVSAVSGRHMFFRGPPGTGKTELLQDFGKICGGNVFDTVLGVNTLRDEVEGPIDVPYLQSTGKQRRNREGMLTDCEFAVLDEVWKANSGLLNQLLRIMSQGDYFEDGQVQLAKTRSIFGASNEGPQGPSLEALHSRFMLRSIVEYVSTPEHRNKLLGFNEWNRPEIAEDMLGSLDFSHLDKIRNAAQRMPVCPKFVETWTRAIRNLRNCRQVRKKSGIILDDRRCKALIEIAKVWALLGGKNVLTKEYALILQYTAWDSPKEKVFVEEAVRSAVKDRSVNVAAKSFEEVKSVSAVYVGTDMDETAQATLLGKIDESASEVESGHVALDIREVIKCDLTRRSYAEAQKVL